MNNVKSLPAGWVISTLGNSCEIVLGQSPSSNTYNSEGIGLPFYQGKSEFGDMYPKPVKWCSKPQKLAKANDILISVRAPVGPSNLCKEDSCIGRGLAAIRTKNNMPSKYFMYYLRLIEKEWDNKATGTTFKAITGSVLRNQEIPLAPLPEQERIVKRIESLFTQLDAGVTGLKSAQAALKRYKASVLKAACEGRLVPQDPSDELAVQLLQRLGNLPLTSEELHTLPKGWCWTLLPAIGELARGKSKHRPRNASFLYGGPYPFVQTGDIRRAIGTITTYSQTYSDAGLKQSKLWKKGTLCITIAANIAETAVLGFDACFPDSVVGFIPLDKIETRFIQFFINTVKDDLERYAPATAQKNINLDILQKLVIPLPPLAEQHRIVSDIERRLSVVQELEQSIEANLTRAARLRQAILKHAFEGSLV